VNRILLVLVALIPSCAPSGKVCEPLERRECTCNDGESSFEYCNSTGHWWTPCDCTCRPDCNSRACGDDGCGGSCGECINRCTGEPDPSLCVAGTCQYVCCPHTCENIAKQCGSWHDGCGSFIECGPCAEGFFCQDGVCLEQDRLCLDDHDCPTEYECREGVCRRIGGDPERCTTSFDCPPGYFCESRRCDPCPERPDLPECQANGEECLSDADCPPEFPCMNGFCYPDNEPDAVIPGTWGSWNIHQYFNLSEAVAGLSTVDALNKLTVAIYDCEYTGIGFVDDLICDLHSEYIPDWTLTLIDIFANLANILSELRSKGTTIFIQLSREELIFAYEEWDTIFIRYLNACCEGQPPGCNPYNQPDYPDCATIDIDTGEFYIEDVELLVHPYNGKIRVYSEDTPERHLLFVGPRLVELNYYQFTSFLVDRLVQIFTGYDDLDEALENIKDCDSIQDLVDDLLGGWAPDIRQTCENSKPSSGELLVGILGQIGTGMKPIRFTGWATITVVDTPPYATHLGFPDFEIRYDGRLSGTATIVNTGDVDGAWFGAR
jgi:hypothetical protein